MLAWGILTLVVAQSSVIIRRMVDDRSPSREFAAPRPLGLRVFDGLRRRGRHAWRRLSGVANSPGTPAAVDWLLDQTTRDVLRGNVGSVATMLPVLSAFGQRESFDRLLAHLSSQQSADGTFHDAAGEPCPILTGQVLSVLLRLDPASHSTALRASHWLAQQVNDHPASLPPGSLISWSSPAVRLIPLAALARSGAVLNQPEWTNIARRAAQELRRRHDLSLWTMPTHWFAPIVRAMLDLDWTADAQRALELPAALQRPAGEVPALPDVKWVSSAGLAELAICWQELQEYDRADAALAALRARQSADGGFAGSWGPEAAYHPRRQTIATACRFLEASLNQVSATFARGGHLQCDTIDSDDGRLLAVRDFLQNLPPGSRVADVGCGPGRYLARLRQWFPQYEWTGIDACATSLQQLPPDVERVTGSLLDLPIGDGRYEAVYCVEALEHSLLPRQAVAELCRIVRPGGRVLVIDKHRRFQGLSHHEPWEVWFTPEEVSQWLGAASGHVAWRPIPHGADKAANGLFLSWNADIRGSAHQRAA